MLAIVPKCFCLFAQRSIECLLGTDEDAKVPEGTLGKEHGSGSPTSPDLIGLSEESSHEFVKKFRWGLQIIRIKFVMAQSTQSSISYSCVRSTLLLKVSEIVSSDLIGVWLATLQSLVLVWSHRTLMEGSALRDDRLWLCNIESSRNCNAMVRMCNGNGAKGVTENVRNVTEMFEVFRKTFGK